jgi:PIN domain nuclease of toxin-antitoxin system
MRTSMMNTEAPLGLQLGDTVISMANVMIYPIYTAKKLVCVVLDRSSVDSY